MGVRTCLDAVGYEVEVAENGEEAMELIEQGHPDLILLDLMLPKVNGYEVLESLKTDPGTGSIPVVVLTAKAEEEDRLRATELGADAYMTKPFRPQELWDVLKKFLPDEEDSQ
ncbi:MAG: response regulator [Firmicutes bacterium]|nr:response regulator [Bacillota bacterium]